MTPFSRLKRVRRWIVAAGLGFGLLGSALPAHAAQYSFTKTVKSATCEFIDFEFKFYAEYPHDAVDSDEDLAELATTRISFGDLLPAGLSWHSAEISGDITGPAAGPIPPYSIVNGPHPASTLKWGGLRLSATDLDGIGDPTDSRNFTILARAKIDKAAFPAPVTVHNQATLSVDEPGPGAIVLMTSHYPDVPIGGDPLDGEKTPVEIDVTDCPDNPGGGDDEDAPCFEVEHGEIDCDPLGGGVFLYKMPVGPEMGGRTIMLKSLTLGVVVAPASQVVPIGGGVLVWSIWGALPGMDISLAVTGIDPLAGPIEGLGLCCAQRIDIHIPDDLDCPDGPRKEANIQIEKKADVPFCTREGEDCNFTIIATNTGDADYVGDLVIEEITSPGLAGIASIGGDPWTCGLDPVLGYYLCKLSGDILTPGETRELNISFKPGAAWADDFIHNCAIYNYEKSGKAPFGNLGDDSGCAEIQICEPGDICVAPIEGAKGPDLVVKKTSTQWTCSWGRCSYDIHVINVGDQTYTGEIRLTDIFETLVPDAVELGMGTPWQCEPVTTGKKEHVCVHPETTLAPNAEMTMRVTGIFSNPTAHPGESVKNCATVEAINGEKDITNNGPSCVSLPMPIEPFQQIKIRKTGEAICEAGQTCSFNIEVSLVSNDNPVDGVRVRFLDAMTVNGAAAQSMEIVSIIPPLGCDTEPSSLPINCTARVGLNAFETRQHRITVRVPEGINGIQNGPVSSSNCFAAVAPDATQDDAAIIIGGIGQGDGSDQFSCHPFELARHESNRCLNDMVQNSQGLCECPDGTRWNGRRCAGGIDPTVPPVDVLNCRTGWTKFESRSEVPSGWRVYRRGSSANRIYCAKQRKETVVECRDGYKKFLSRSTIPSGWTSYTEGEGYDRFYCAKPERPKCRDGYTQYNSRSSIPKGWKSYRVVRNNKRYYCAKQDEKICRDGYTRYGSRSSIPKGWKSYRVVRNNKRYYCAKPDETTSCPAIAGMTAIDGKCVCKDGWKPVYGQTYQIISCKREPAEQACRDGYTKYNTRSSIPKGWKNYRVVRNNKRYYCAKRDEQNERQICRDGYTKFNSRSSIPKGWKNYRVVRNNKRYYCAKRDEQGERQVCRDGYKKYNSRSSIPKGWKSYRVTRGLKRYYCAKPGRQDGRQACRDGYKKYNSRSSVPKGWKSYRVTRGTKRYYCAKSNGSTSGTSTGTSSCPKDRLRKNGKCCPKGTKARGNRCRRTQSNSSTLGTNSTTKKDKNKNLKLKLQQLLKKNNKP